MDAQVDRLVEKTWQRYKSLPPSKRLLISISGIPGSGKTSLALTLTARLNALHAQAFPGSATTKIAVVVPMDGFHYTRAQLAAFPNPVHAFARRGAAFTFDAPALLALVKRIRAPLTAESKTILAPSFDHKIKDPVEGDVSVGTKARVVVFEGNYLGLGTGVWGEVVGLMDEVWVVDVSEETARRRLIERHVRTGVEADEAAATRRADENDLVNGREILRDRVDKIDEVIQSLEDEDWKPKIAEREQL